MRSPVSGTPETQFGGERHKRFRLLIAFGVRHLPGPLTTGGHSRV